MNGPINSTNYEADAIIDLSLGAGLMNENRILILTPDVAMELWYLVVISLGAGA